MPNKLSELFASPGIRKLAELAGKDQLRGSWLLYGPKGSGKAALGRELVELAHPEAGDVDGDLQIVSGDMGVDEIREALKSMSFTPTNAKSKILVVEGAEALNMHSANALLKTLEEPPSYGLILLTASDPNKILPTVLSRCYRVKLPVIDDAVLLEWISEHYELEEKLAASIVKEAAGRLGIAQALAADPAALSNLLSRKQALMNVVDGDFVAQMQWVNNLPGREQLVQDLQTLLEVLKEELEAGHIERRHALRIFDHSLQLIQKFIHPKLVLTYSFLRLASLRV